MTDVSRITRRVFANWSSCQPETYWLLVVEMAHLSASLADKLTLGLRVLIFDFSFVTNVDKYFHSVDALTNRNDNPSWM